MSDVSRFTRLKFQIYGKTKEELLKVLLPLEKYPEVSKLKRRHQFYQSIMCYLIFLYDPGTELNHEFYRLEDRKTQAAELSGLNKIKDLSLYNKVFNNTSPEILDIIHVLFTQVYHDRKYREWQTLHNELDEYTRARWEKIDKGNKPTRKRKKKDEEEFPEDMQEGEGNKKAALEALTTKGKLRDECKKIHDLLDQLEKEIFGDHKDLLDTAYKSRFLSPENWSGSIQKLV